ncbi:MAG: riboflavin biosynthesis protein RibD [bacterium]|nr:MAG: riboflavin biosynthesis protein RibD [bacterium]
MKSPYMRRALDLAVRARGCTSPNPMVGAVIVKSGKIIAEGFHKKAGGDHAEIAALKAIRKAKKSAKGAILYVTLEPCCHRGKTPPCTDAVVASGIKKVVLAARDPNPLVAGKGIEKLKKAGITVLEGLLQKEAKKLNEAYEKFITQKVPFVVMKAASSLDGKIASETGQSKWITNETARKKVHEMRQDCDVVMVGINTILKDDPSLNVRPVKKGAKQPLRLIVDTTLKTEPDASVFHSQGGRVLIAAGTDAPASRLKPLEQKGAEILRIGLKNDRVNLKELMKALAKMNVVSILLEGGGELFTSALASGIVDRVALFYAPIILGGSGRYSMVHGKGVKQISDAMKIHDVAVTQLDGNILVEGAIAR